METVQLALLAYVSIRLAIRAIAFGHYFFAAMETLRYWYWLACKRGLVRVMQTDRIRADRIRADTSERCESKQR